jgi:hypothetical protein
MARTSRLRRIMGAAGLITAALLVVLMVATAEPFDPDSFGPDQDARAYWAVAMSDPYVPGSVGHESAYLYSPAFLVAISPLRALPWPWFVGLWTILLLATLYWLAGPLLFLPAMLLTFPEIWGGNITILLAAAIVIGFSRPAAWAFPLLTKVTPGLGLLWFVVRRQWGALAMAAVATLAVMGVTALLVPGLWADWFALLASSTGSSTVPGSVPIPLVLRLPVAAGVIVLAARRDMRWLLPVGVLLAMPVIWWGSLAILVASVAVERDAIEVRFERAVAQLGGPGHGPDATRPQAAPAA